jgi:hypothetical protein
MTDTPRTRAELLTDFADQQNHGITAQKMRNFVVSSSVDPLYRGFSYWSVTGNGSTVLATVPAAGSTTFGDVVILPFGVNKAMGASEFHAGIQYRDDSYSILDTDPDVTWATVDAGNAFMLEPGLWNWRTHVATTSAHAFTVPASPTVSVPMFVSLEQAEYDSTFDWPADADGTQPFVYAGWQNSLEAQVDFPVVTNYPLGQDPGETRVLDVSGVVLNDTDVAKPFMLVGFCQVGWTSAVDLVAYSLGLWRSR